MWVAVLEKPAKTYNENAKLYFSGNSFFIETKVEKKSG